MLTPAQKVTIVAEVGVNHGGDYREALRLSDAALAAGADVVKFQLFEPLCCGNRARRRLLSPLALSRTQISELCEHVLEVAGGRNDSWMVTPFDTPSLDYVVQLHPAAMKVSSRFLRDHEFLREIRAKWDGPIWQSLGGADRIGMDANEAYAITKPAVVLHCISAYPTPVAACDLLAMAKLTNPGGRIGWSDHTGVPHIAPLAVALGATVIEAHIKSETSGGPDLASSLSARDFEQMVRMVWDAEAALGNGLRNQCEAEAANRKAFPVTT